MKIRLDKLLLVRNLAESRQKSQALIAAGLVFVNGQRADKVGTQFPDTCNIEIKGKKCPYVSRGGLKLAGALDHFQIDPTGFVCADIGASTGGFTDCLLQRGAVRVFAVDVGYGQLDWKLRQDDRVVVMERTNARHLAPGDIPETIDLAVIDASFISLELLLKPVLIFLKPGGKLIALIKPQFEVGKGLVGKGGVVKDPDLHQATIDKIGEFGTALGLENHGAVPSSILGPKGNQEFLIYFTRP
ncbi:MAG: TlyA family RNA methyltransferase [Thermodesulfobacteriota bacterium]